MKDILIYGIGFLAQVLFFARTIVQWFKSEHEGKVLSPVLFWQISLVGSTLMFLYGLFRNDFAIIFGQMIVYFIYVRNLQLKDAWSKLHWGFKTFIFAFPVAIAAYLIWDTHYSVGSFLKNEDIPLWLMIWGIAGQITFTFRFIYQWIYSENRKDSLLPMGFWVISLCGSAMIFVYSLFREDPVLFAAHSFGAFVYIRNMLLYRNKTSIFSRFNTPFVKRIVKRVSEKIN